MASRMAGLLTVILLAATTTASAQDKRLTFLDRPLVVQCGRDDRPFLRVTVNAEDGQGNPVDVELGADPVSRGFRVFEGTNPHKVIHVSTQESSTSKGNSVLLLLDTSGSMKNGVTGLKGGPSRFTAAKDAIKQSVNGFVDGADQIAIAQFDSHNVARRIQAAQFLGKAQDVRQQVDRLEPPTNGNTALYSAVAEALPILERRRKEGYSVALVVFTDGENDVNKSGDDPGLLDGDRGLDTALAAVAKAKVPIFTIGFGVTGNPKVEGPLKRIAFPDQGNFRDARTDARRLTEILELVRQKLAHQIRILFGPVRDTRQDLRSGDLPFSVDLTAGTTTVRSQTTNVWHAPVGTGVAAETQCTEDEARAIEANAPITGPVHGPWDRIVIFVTFAVIIAGLWFAAPRFVWPESYIPRPVIPPLPATNLPPGVQGPPQPQMPTWDRMRGSGAPPAYEPPPRSSRPPSPPSRSGPPDQTVVVSPRPAARPGPTPPPPPAPPRNVPPPREDPGRGPDDETIYIPPPKNPYRK